MEYQVVYSAALERQRLGLTLSSYQGPSTLAAFGAEDSLHNCDVEDMYKHAQKVKLPFSRRGRPKSVWHRNRSKAAA